MICCRTARVSSNQPSPATIDPTASRRVSAGIRILARPFGEETAIFFEGPSETMVVNPLGAAALSGIAKGLLGTEEIERWCRSLGCSTQGEDISGNIQTLLEMLNRLEIIEPSA